jgi:kynurenine formamidase
MTRSQIAGVLITVACVSGAAVGLRGQQPAGGARPPATAPRAGGGVQALVVDDAESARRGFKKNHDGPQTVAEYEALFKSISNWGRWGKDDQLGAMNLITDAKRKQAAKLVKHGIAVSLSHTAVTETTADMPAPFELSGGGSTFKYSFHSTTHSHLDAICQFDYKGQLFNGWQIKDTKSAKGCTTLDVDALKNGLTTRGVLIDIPRLRGVKYLEPGTPIYPEEIEAWEKKAGVKIGPGDAIFLRTGRWLRRAEKGPWQLFPAPPGEGEAGYHVSCPAWFKKRDVAIVGADVSNDVTPHVEVAGEVLSLTRGMPVHSLTIVALGGIIIDALDLEAVAETAARLNKWEFMLVGAPPRVTGATGGLINLTAIF